MKAISLTAALILMLAAVPAMAYGTGSCENLCGEYSGEPDDCHCDSACMTFNDCCDDVCLACPDLGDCIDWNCGDGNCDAGIGESCTYCINDCACPDGQSCYEDACCETSCDGLLCGDDGCGGTCGDCEAGFVCDDQGQCIEAPKCEVAKPIACGDLIELDNTGYQNLLNDYSCSGFDESGPEVGFEFVALVDEEITVSIEDGDIDLDLFLLEGACTAEECLDYTGISASFEVLHGLTYYIVVDGYKGDAGPFTLTLVCPSTCGDGTCQGAEGCEECPEDCLCEDGQTCFEDACCTPVCDGEACTDDGCGGLCPCPDEGDICFEETCCTPSCDGKVCGDDGCGADCGECDLGYVCDDAGLCGEAPKCEAPEAIKCGEVHDGDTTQFQNLLDDYECASFDESGPEVGYMFTALATEEISVSVESGDEDLDVFLLEEMCSADACLDYVLSSGEIEVEEGKSYFIVVDGWQGAAGPFELSVACPSDCGNGFCQDTEGCESCPEDCTCPDGESCYKDECCVPSCEGKLCGGDGCGGDCGACDAGFFCKDGGCLENTCPDEGDIPDCWDGCTTGSWVGDNICDSAFKCEDYNWDDGDCDPCYPSCEGQECGSNGCGGSCGECEDGLVCDDANCITQDGCVAWDGPGCGGCACEECVIAMDSYCGTSSWDSICVGECENECGGCVPPVFCDPACEPGFECIDEECVPCEPDCDGLACGNDGCGGSCGECVAGEDCMGGLCVNPNSCAGNCGGNADSGCFCDELCFDNNDCCPGICGDCPDIGLCAAFACGNDECEAEAGEDCMLCPIDCGCGPDCGLCPSGFVCTDDNICEADCVPTCEGKDCGPDLCGGFCGECEDGFICTNDGLCEEECVADCTDLDCGDDGCGGSCGECSDGFVCNNDGLCEEECVPACDGLDCGDDGCGGSCGECGQGLVCNDDGLCEAECVPECAGKDCGDDGCGDVCGDCAANAECIEGSCQLIIEEDVVTDAEGDSTVPSGDVQTDASDDGGDGGDDGCSTSGSGGSAAALWLLLALAGLLYGLRRRNAWTA